MKRIPVNRYPFCNDEENLTRIKSPMDGVVSAGYATFFSRYDRLIFRILRYENNKS